MRQPTVTVLIPAHNEAATIKTVLEAVWNSPFRVDQVFVVADACTDNTAQLAMDAGATKVWETDYKDKAQAQNEALPHITTDVVVGFDGDSWPTGDCIGMMVRDLYEHGWDATCSTILPAQQHGWPFEYEQDGREPTMRQRFEGYLFTGSRNFAYALGRRWWRLCQAKVGRIQVLTGACYAFRTDVIKAIGGFPNGLITADMDATWRLHEAGYRLGYTGDALTMTLDPESFAVYSKQMNRWASGYYQNMAKHRKQLKNWRSALVVGTAVLDLLLLFFYSGYLSYSLITWSNHGFLQAVVFWTAIHWAVSLVMVQSVIGWKKAFANLLPYTLVNLYNKYVYFKGFVREWILGRHYASWTGRQGRKVEITPMTKARRQGLAAVLLGASVAATVMAQVPGSVVAGALAVCSFAGGVVLYPWRGGGKHAAPRKKETRVSSRPAVPAIPAQRSGDDTVPLQVLLYDPDSTITTELPAPMLYRGQETD